MRAFFITLLQIYWRVSLRNDLGYQLAKLQPNCCLSASCYTTDGGYSLWPATCSVYCQYYLLCNLFQRHTDCHVYLTQAYSRPRLLCKPVHLLCSSAWAVRIKKQRKSLANLLQILAISDAMTQLWLECCNAAHNRTQLINSIRSNVEPRREAIALFLILCAQRLQAHNVVHLLLKFSNEALHNARYQQEVGITLCLQHPQHHHITQCLHIQPNQFPGYIFF